MRLHAGPMADALVVEIAKAAKDAKTEVARSADLVDYTAEEGLRSLGQGKLLNSDSFPGRGALTPGPGVIAYYTGHTGCHINSCSLTAK